jgi:hypothetical protein
MVHYVNGVGLPINGEVKQFGISTTLQRMLIFQVESKEWDESTIDQPFVVVFEGNHCATFDEKGQPVRHAEINENPRRQ